MNCTIELWQDNRTTTWDNLIKILHTYLVWMNQLLDTSFFCNSTNLMNKATIQLLPFRYINYHHHHHHIFMKDKEFYLPTKFLFANLATKSIVSYHWRQCQSNSFRTFCFIRFSRHLSTPSWIPRFYIINLIPI